MSEIDYNPARRLHDIISAGPTPGDKETVWKAFSSILDVPTSEPGELWDRISLVLQLPSIIKKAIDEIPAANSDLHLSWYPKAVAATESFGVKNNWKSFAAFYPPENLMALNFCALLISEHQPERKINDVDLSSILQQVNKLITDLDSVELRSPDWLFMRHHLLKIRKVLERYTITGIHPIGDVYEQTIGAMLLNPDVRDKLQNDEKGKRFYKIVGVVATLLSIYGGVSAITHDVSKIIDKDGIMLNEDSTKQLGTENEDAILDTSDSGAKNES